MADHFAFPGLQVEVDLLDVSELPHQALATTAGVTEVLLAERRGRNVEQLLLGGSGVLGPHGPGRVARGQGDG
ncbi:hypothetical protein ACIPSA_35555 [Streptomyces sp. NPDC086549]|uniref:hypothetical protein n=1 Tax=Streptomyces sp. NPDC086549 TaxID=3365752 RepID=UPI00380870D5